MIDGSEKRNHQLAFEFHDSRVFEKRSNSSHLQILCRSVENMLHAC